MLFGAYLAKSLTGREKKNGEKASKKRLLFECRFTPFCVGFFLAQSFYNAKRLCN